MISYDFTLCRDIIKTNRHLFFIGDDAFLRALSCAQQFSDGKIMWLVDTTLTSDYTYAAMDHPGLTYDTPATEDPEKKYSVCVTHLDNLQQALQDYPSACLYVYMEMLQDYKINVPEVKNLINVTASLNSVENEQVIQINGCANVINAENSKVFDRDIKDLTESYKGGTLRPTFIQSPRKAVKAMYVSAFNGADRTSDTFYMELNTLSRTFTVSRVDSGKILFTIFNAGTRLPQLHHHHARYISHRAAMDIYGWFTQELECKDNEARNEAEYENICYQLLGCADTWQIQPYLTNTYVEFSLMTEIGLFYINIDSYTPRVIISDNSLKHVAQLNYRDKKVNKFLIRLCDEIRRTLSSNMINYFENQLTMENTFRLRATKESYEVYASDFDKPYLGVIESINVKVDNHTKQAAICDCQLPTAHKNLITFILYDKIRDALLPQ